MPSFVVAGAGSGLADATPVRPVPQVGEGVANGTGDTIEQSSNLVDCQGNQFTGTGFRSPFWASRRKIVRKAAAAIDRVMCRYQAV